MDNRLEHLINKLENEKKLTVEEYEYLISNRTEDAARVLSKKARNVREAVYGKSVFIRGLIEVSSYCKNDCLYCGLRRSNLGCERYRLTKDDIMDCCRQG